MSTLRDEYEAGAGLMAMARKHRMTYHALRSLLRAEGVRVRKPGCPPGTTYPTHKNRKLATEKIPALVTLAREKGNVAAALVFGLTRQRVSQIMRSFL